jgi:hypothetical protein
MLLGFARSCNPRRSAKVRIRGGGRGSASPPRCVVLANFAAADPNRSLKERVLKILAEYRVRAVSPEQVAAFAEEVQREAH